MTISDVLARTVVDSLLDKSAIETALTTIYNGSPLAAKMINDWLAKNSDNKIEFIYQKDTLQGPFNTGKVLLDPALIARYNYVNDNGQAIELDLIHLITHELGHSLTGTPDNPTYILDYKGDNLRLTNPMLQELGIEERNSYSGAADDSILTSGFEYTNGATVDRVVSKDRDWNSSIAMISDDLLIGGPSNNVLESGLGDDFLFGGGGDDHLNGGLFGTDTVVLTGKPVDYDIRLNDDGTWTSRHVRGTTLDGTDRFKNLEKVHFAGTQTYDLSNGGLKYQSDFAFVIDQTGSMYDDIAAVKASAAGVIDAIFADNTIDGRIGIVGFRDNTIGEPTSVILPFTDQDSFAARKTAAITAINSIGVGGGGDFPETAFDGLLKALDGTMGDWREGAGTKKIVLFTDATAKDAFLLPTVLSYASNIGVKISASSSASLGTIGAVDTFVLGPDMSGQSGFDPSTEGESLPPFVPSGDPVQAPEGAATVAIYTIFVDTFTFPDPNLTEVASATSGAVLNAATPQEVVDLLLTLISGNSSPQAVDDAFSVNEDEMLSGNVLDDNGNGSDSDPDGDTLTVSLISGPVMGRLTLNDDGSFRYEADADVFDLASPGDVIEQHFIYQVDDGNGGVGQATATISVTTLDDGETVAGGNGRQTLIGTDGGEDLLLGENGDDELYGLDGSDTLDGGRGDDLLFGGESSDFLFGGQGNDLLHGGLGMDELTGGKGDDNFVFAPGEGTDTIMDFGVGEDSIVFEGFSPDGLTIGQTGDDATISVDGNLVVILVGVDSSTLGGSDLVYNA